MRRSRAAKRGTRERDVFGRGFRATCNDLLFTCLLTRLRAPRLGCRASLLDFVARAARSQAPWPHQDLAKGAAQVHAASQTRSWRLQYRLAMPALCLGAVDLLLGWLVPH